MLKKNELIDAEYLGRNDSTSCCVFSVARLLYSNEILKKALLITNDQSHGFILFGQLCNIYVIKIGFSSGYPGEGPRGLSTTIKLMQRHKIDIDEYEVDKYFINQIKHASLLQSDIEQLLNSKPIRPQRLIDYLLPNEPDLNDPASYLSYCYPPSLPYNLIDHRLIDLAIKFNEDEDQAVTLAYRRLEDIVRNRTGIADSGSKLFSRAFLSDDSPLTWNVQDYNEAKGRANMFTSVFGAYRNARMHREQKHCRNQLLREFLLANELFQLEASAVTRVPKSANN